MAWKFRKLEPQPARGKLSEAMWDDENWVAEEKFDGERRIAQFCGRTVRFTGRPSRVTGDVVEKTAQLPHLSNAGSFKVPGASGDRRVMVTPPPASLDGTVLDGELILPEGYEVEAGGKSKAVTSIANSAPEEAVKKQWERGWLRYVVFDCLFYKGKDVRGESLYNRRFLIEEAFKAWGNPYVIKVEQYSDKRDALESILLTGGEGVVLKRLDHRYGDKNLWVKVKAEWTADVIILGYKDAKEMSKKVDGSTSMTKYAKAGLIGAIRCGQFVGGALTEVATVSGMDDDLRAELTKNGKEYVGQVIEVKHNGQEPTGRFRHPRFRRFRDDKRAEDCVQREGEI